jgi:hypothetical protein
MLLLKEDRATIAAFVMYLHLFSPERPRFDSPNQLERHFGKSSVELRYSLKSEAMALGTEKP